MGLSEDFWRLFLENPGDVGFMLIERSSDAPHQGDEYD
jgi:hypothetical protein